MTNPERGSFAEQISDKEEKNQLDGRANKPSDDRVSRRDFLKIIGGAATAMFSEKLSAQEPETPRPEARFEKIKQNLVESFKRNQDYVHEIGENNLELLSETLQNLNLEKIRSIISEVAGKSIANPGIKSLSFVTERQAKEVPNLSSVAVGYTDGENIGISLKGCLDDEGKFDPAIFYRIFVHEYTHLLTVDQQRPKSERTPWVDEHGLPADLYEGMTELQTIKICDKLGYRPENFYGYAGGNLIAAYYIDRITEGQATQDFFDTGSANLKKSLEKKLGRNSWNELFGSRKEVAAEALAIGEINDLDTIFKLLRMSEQAKLDYGQILTDAKNLGIDEQVEVIYGKPNEKKDILGIVDSKVYKEGLAVSGIIVDPKPLHKLLPKFSFFVSAGRGTSYTISPEGLKEADKSSDDLFARYLKFAKEAVSDIESMKASGMSEEKLLQYGQRIHGFAFNFYLHSEYLSEQLKKYQTISGSEEKEKKRRNITTDFKNEMSEIISKFQKNREE